MNDDFRNSISTVSDKGKRVWVYPKKPSGNYHTARIVVASLLIIFFFSAPFIRINEHPMFLFNLLERKFVLFGLPFGPHDFHIFVIGFISLIVFIVLFTAIFGRLFCGWICPQTVFMELVFRKIEYWLEGDYKQQIELNKSVWTKKKLLKKSLKHIIFFLISLLIANIFLAYIIGTDNALNYIKSGPEANFSSFLAVLAFTVIFYLIFSRFREQACIIVCPYGRLQGVLLDENSLAVSYDFVRGEPRKKGKIIDGENRGDCIDCGNCVYVCPTGIDIRNGIQLECINCTACIDACDAIMEKINKPKGLIRYDSLKGIKEKVKFKFSLRLFGYSALLTVLLSVFIILYLNRSDIDIKILRTPGMLYQEQANNKISNLYNINIVNKTFNNINISIKLANIDGEIRLIGEKLSLGSLEKYDGKFLLIIDKNKLTSLNTPIKIIVYEEGKEIRTINTSFLSHIGIRNE